MQEEMARTPGLKYVELEDGTIGVEVGYNDGTTTLSMEQCVAMMLAKLVKITLNSTGAKPGDCVISIPAYYTDAQRVAMLHACEIAQLHCLRLLHEGTAVALEYGMFKSAKGVFDTEKAQTVAFLDLGHASFSCTIASFVTGKLTIKAATYDRSLGGRNFDEVIARKIAAAFKAKHKDDPWDNAKARMKLMDAGEKAKKMLSPVGVTEAPISCECLLNDIDFNMKLGLDEFVADCEPLLARMTPVLMQAIAQSGLAPADINTIEIIGGSTRLGFVKARMADILAGSGVAIDKTANNCGLFTTMNADEAVARGTAWQAALLSTRFRVKEFQVLEAASFPVKLMWEPVAGGAAAAGEGDDDEGEGADSSGSVTSAVLFKKNEVTPSAKKVTFRRAAPFTVTAAYDDLSALPAGTDATIRSFQIQVPAGSGGDGGAPKIRVNVKHDLHGVVTVASAQLMEEIKEEKDAAAEGDAKEDEPPKKKRFRKVELAVTSSAGGMSDARLAQAKEFEVAMDNADRVIEETLKARNDVESYIYVQRDALAGDLARFCTAKEKGDQEALLAEMEEWLYNGDGYDAQKSVYVEKLKQMKKSGEKTDFRATEAAGREERVAALKSALDEYKGWLVAAGSDEKYAHIGEDEKAGVRAACAAAEAWLFNALEAQGKLEDSADPTLTADALGQQQKALVDACKPIVNKPKPKVEAKAEAKSEEKAAEAPKEEEGEPKAEGDAKPDAGMDTESK
jgi:heat shock protein 4